jgi:4-hydroxy-tetrahydrodipicolinate synthase
MSSSLPDGVLAASLTPLTSDGTPNGPALAHHVRRLLQTGCDAVLLFGTTGEGLSFTVDERTAALEAVLKADVPPHRLLVGTGALPLPDATTLTAHATRHGVGGVLIMPPFHLPTPTDEGLISSYDRIIQSVGASDLHLYFYHYPQLFGTAVPFPLIEELRTRYPEVVAGVKDSSGEWDHFESLCTSFPELQMFTGTERFLSPGLAAGGAGCISATANLTAPIAQAVLRTWRDGKDPAPIQSVLTERREALSRFHNIPALKQMMAWQTDEDTWTRVQPPLSPLKPEMVDELRTVYDDTEAACDEWGIA